MEKLIDISSYPVAQVLDVLLQDKTTKKNIIWATDTYAEFGEEFTDKVQMDANAFLLRPDIIVMPTQLFYSVTIPATLWFITKGKKQKGKTLRTGCVDERWKKYHKIKTKWKGLFNNEKIQCD